LTKLLGYQQPTYLCIKMEFFHVNCSLLTFVQLFSFMRGRHNCVREAVFHFTCVVLWKLHG